MKRFDLIVRSQITIDRSVKEVWPRFLSMDDWMTDNRFLPVGGERGEEGEVRQVVPKEETPYRAYLIETVRIIPFEQYVLKVVSEEGSDYFGFADFSFTEVGDQTRLIYDIYVELKVTGKSEEEFQRFSSEQYAITRELVTQNNQNLKALVESSKVHDASNRSF